ncbi:septum formation family protein [Pengzhenrongella sicca]|uniref:Septum formation family protein n=1 Tax=Pengzhenrongella sicca TaxID=2819238 RepID=A0A8A4ZFI7_9MICO|nr:septum formation family protein [Pengzhenrongella sicca]QTE29257.1 septum formation family protein [Pengzhenrongella sicca]
MEHNSRRRRRATLAAAVLAGALALVGCGATGDPDGPDSPAPIEPTASAAASGPFAVGDCWQEDDYVAASGWLTWEGGEPVDCGAGHNSITVAAPSLDADFEYPVDAARELTEPTREAAAVVGRACHELALDVLPDGAPEASMVNVMWYLPTAEQWAAGQRQVRCDVTLNAFGEAQSAQEMQPLPPTLADLAAALRADPLAFEACALTADGVATGPYTAPATTTFVRCDEPHTWRWLDRTELTAPADAPYPGDAPIEDESAQACLSAGVDENGAWWMYWPDAATWAAGDRSIDCWIGSEAIST